MDREVLKGHLDALLLAVLEDGPAHGYAVIERLRAKSEAAFVLPEGTVYPALHRLEDGDLLSSRWVAHEGRQRRVYALTPAGRRALVRRRREWGQFSAAVSRTLEPA